MKMYKKLFLMLLVSSVAFAWSCKKDDDTDPEKPSLTVSADKSSAAVGEQVAFTISSTAPSGATLKRLLIEEKISGSSGKVTLKDSTLSSSNIGYTYNYTIPSGASGSMELVFTVTDNANTTQSVTKSITITSSGSKHDCNSVVLGSYNNVNGSFFSSSDCAVYTVGQAKNNQSNVDFIYFFGSTNSATLAAPDNSDAASISTYALNTWTVKNSTKFKKLSSGFDFAGATAASIEEGFKNSTATEDSKANNLSIGSIVAFRTVAGKYGVVKITNITGTDAGTAQMDVKVQN